MIHPARFKEKTVVVTGGAQGIGRTVALQAAQEGGNVVLVDRSELVAQVVEEAVKLGLNAIYFLADVETLQGCSDAMQFAEKTYGTIDVLINNVGGTIWTKPFVYYTEDQIVKEIHRSLFPTLWGCRAVLPYFLKAGKGVIVNISSVATKSIHRIPYAAAKGGVNAITASLACEYAPHNIRINAIAPGGTEAPPREIPRNPSKKTEQEQVWYDQIVAQTISYSLMKRYGNIQEQVNAILFMASDESSYITGTILPVGGGDLG